VDEVADSAARASDAGGDPTWLALLRDAVTVTGADFGLIAVLVDPHRVLIQAGLGDVAEQLVGT
jgi:hypothetical protein